MPEIQAFRGLRYDLGHVGSLSGVVAPPYDVIDADLQTALYQSHPANVIRLILNRTEPGDGADADRYRRAAQFLKNWRTEGVLQRESTAAIYPYHQVFQHDGQSVTRRGFMCRVRLERFGEGTIFPHEETHAAAKADRLKLIQACRANLSQIFGLFPDPDSQVQQTIDLAVSDDIPLEATDHLGVVHRIWPVTDVQTISQVAGNMANHPIFIADGHHRYETACNYRDMLAANSQLEGNHAANFVLMMCVGMSDPGMIVLPTHRLFRGMPARTSQQLVESLGSYFDTTICGNGSADAHQTWDTIAAREEQGVLGFYTRADAKWVLAEINNAGRTRMQKIAPDRSEPWRGLGVSILHSLVVENLFGATDLPHPKYVHSVPEVVEALDQGDTTGRDATGQEGHAGDFELAALIMPASLEDVRSVSQNKERMPAKSTYFYPKLLSGLVINPLD